MTALCGGGTSSPRPGVPQQVTVAGTLITEGLGLIQPWLLAFAALIDGFLYQSVSQCSTDPPAMPSFDASDVANLVGGVLNPNISVTLTKINNALLNVFWPRFCQCDNATFVPVPPLQPPPPGALNIIGSPQQPCFQGNWAGFPPSIGTTPNYSQFGDATPQLLSIDNRRQNHTDASGNYVGYGIPSGTTQVTWSVQDTGTQFCTPLFSSGATVRFWDGTGTQVGPDVLPTPSGPGAAASGSFTVPTGAQFWRWGVAYESSATCGNQLAATRWMTLVWCAGSSPGTLTSCCPGPSDLTIGIQNIIKLIQNLPAGGGTGLRAYTKGTVHTGLTGTASLTVSSIVGMLIDVTAGTPTVPQLGGNPPYEWNLGFLSVSTTDGMIQQRRLTRQHMIWIPDQMQLFTIIGLFLGAGVVVTLTELHAA